MAASTRGELFTDAVVHLIGVSWGLSCLINILAMARATKDRKVSSKLSCFVKTNPARFCGSQCSAKLAKFASPSMLCERPYEEICMSEQLIHSSTNLPFNDSFACHEYHQIKCALWLYGLGLVSMLTCSALYNTIGWRTSWDRALVCLDRAFIFIMIAGTFSPLVAINLQVSTLLPPITFPAVFHQAPVLNVLHAIYAF